MLLNIVIMDCAVLITHNCIAFTVLMDELSIYPITMSTTAPSLTVCIHVKPSGSD